MHRQLCPLLIAIVCLLLPAGAWGRDAGTADTLITLEAVRIESHRLSAPGRQNLVIGERQLARHHFESLDRLVARHTGIHIKSYGPGILATTSMRGGSAGHTSLLWNGLDLMNPMNGQADLALLPVFLFDGITVQYGGGSALWGSGPMGGAIHLNSRGPSGEPLLLQGGLQANSLGGFSQRVRTDFRAGPAAAGIRLVHERSDNRYRYANPSMPARAVRIQEHAAFRNRGLTGQFRLDAGRRHRLELDLWLQDSHRDIPPSLYQVDSEALQQDQAFRISAHWVSVFDRAVLNWRSAYRDEFLVYEDSQTPSSKSSWQTLVQEMEARWQATPGVLLSGGLHANSSRAAADNYDQRHRRHIMAFYATAGWQNESGSLQLRLSGRQEVVGGTSIPFMPSAGLSWQVSRRTFLKANAGKNFRLPSLNDLYWSPGGNPDLRPEEGWSQDLSIQWMDRFLEFSLTGFHRVVDNWIIWLPSGMGQLWSPQNIMRVRSHGLEARAGGGFLVGPVAAEWHVRYDRVHSVNLRAKSPNDASLGKQLLYVPRDRAGMGLSIGYRRLSAWIDQQWSGRAYTSSDNSQWLRPWHHADAGLAWRFLLGRSESTLSLGITNLFNQSYELMAGRPMPLRYVTGSLSVTMH
jgi:iron complex outermembrane receptor protein